MAEPIKVILRTQAEQDELDRIQQEKNDRDALLFVRIIVVPFVTAMIVAWYLYSTEYDKRIIIWALLVGLGIGFIDKILGLIIYLLKVIFKKIQYKGASEEEHYKHHEYHKKKSRGHRRGKKRKKKKRKK